MYNHGVALAVDSIYQEVTDLVQISVGPARGLLKIKRFLSPNATAQKAVAVYNHAAGFAASLSKEGKPRLPQHSGSGR